MQLCSKPRGARGIEPETFRRRGQLLSRPLTTGPKVLGAWSVRCVGWADWVDCRCFLSFVFLGVARRLEISPCNTRLQGGWCLSCGAAQPACVLLLRGPRWLRGSGDAPVGCG